MVLAQTRQRDQWNSIESPEINPDTYSQFIFNKGKNHTKWEKDVSSASGAGKSDS